MSASVAAPCDLLPWDTEFFRRRTARLRGDTLTSERMPAIDEWCRREKVQCLYFLARADEPSTIRVAEDSGFALVDIRVTFERALDRERDRAGGESAAGIRAFEPRDLAALLAMARTMHENARFFNDRELPRALAEAFYVKWLTLECEGKAQRVFVAAPDGDAMGYISCHVDAASRAGQIGLVGVDSRARGKALGKGLVMAAVEWLAEQGMNTVTVVTQGGNVPAQRLYQRCGFISRDLQLWYHKCYFTEQPHG